MAGNKGQDKTEQATPRRLQEARRRGQVAKSADLNGALLLLAVVGLLYALKGYYLDGLQAYLLTYLSGRLGTVLEGNNLGPVYLNAVGLFIRMVWPPLALAMVIGLAANLFQVGFLFSTESLKFNWERFNVVAGLGRLITTRSLVELVKSILKVALVAAIVYIYLKGRLFSLILGAAGDSRATAMLAINFILSLASVVTLVYLALGVADFMYQRYEWRKSLRMSRQEIKEEFRQTEGDPLIKGEVKKRQRQVLLNRIRQEVPKATVVVTNPTHLAVALRYVQGEMNAPVVVAKGEGFLAQRIKEIAAEHGVPVIENKEVARFLYRHVEPGQEIPLEIYQAVAEILALVYRLRGRL